MARIDDGSVNCPVGERDRHDTLTGGRSALVERLESLVADEGVTQFPDQRIEATEHGAVGDGEARCTDAIQAAIDRVENAAITGAGTIDGNGEYWWNTFDEMRPESTSCGICSCSRTLNGFELYFYVGDGFTDPSATVADEIPRRSLRSRLLVGIVCPS